MRTRAEAVQACGDRVAEHRLIEEQMSPRELAEAAWTPTCKKSVDELEAEIRAERGLPAKDAAAS